MTDLSLSARQTSEVEEASEELLASLREFQSRFNENIRAKKLVKKWCREILVEARDTHARYTMVVEDERLSTVAPGDPEGRYPDRVHLRSEEATLIEIFTGAYNPATALLDGVLEVYSIDRDKVKLEALAMVIWGL